MSSELKLKKLRVLELYSGIGGFHFALKESELFADVCAAVDINTSANDVYRYNFGQTLVLQRNILSLTAVELDAFELDLIWMSPPCQPFTRIGKQLDCADQRTSSFLHILNELSHMRKKPRYILLENVKGFESSEARAQLLSRLKNDYNVQEFLLTPTQFGIPNSRLRYYMVAKQKPLAFPFPASDVPRTSTCEELASPLQCATLDDYLETEPPDSTKYAYFDSYLVPDKVLLKFGNIFDIVDRNSRNSCCFTKAYTHYTKGTGSVVHGNPEFKVSEIYGLTMQLPTDCGAQEKLSLLKSLKLRYFTPREAANLLGFPKEFEFPEAVTLEQRYRLLGNSLNVKVVGELLKFCYDDLSHLKNKK